MIVETERLVIRPPRPGDGRAHAQAVGESLAELRQWPASLRWALEEPSEDASEAYCRRAAEEFEKGKDFALFFLLRETGEIAGASGLHDPDWTIPSFEIGWWGRTSLTGRGLISEGSAAVLRWGLDQLRARRIFALVDEQNAPSCRVCERIGMELEGTLRNARADPDGRLHGSCLYASIA